MGQTRSLPTVQSELEAGIGAGLHLGAQVYASIEWEPRADFAVGLAQPGVAMTVDHLCQWMSATKPVAALAIAIEAERGHLKLDQPVVDFIPEFGRHGKDAITLRHILTHTGGFRSPPIDFATAGWNEIIRANCEATLEAGWTPGEKAGYHVHSGWYILAEVIRRLTNRRFRHYVRDEIFCPLGMDDCWIGMEPEVHADYDHAGLISHVYDTSGQEGQRGRGVDMGRHSAEWNTHGRPSTNGCGPARQLARLYEMLLGEGTLECTDPRDGKRIDARALSPESVRLFTTRQRVAMYDHTFMHHMDWGLGFIINSNHYSDKPGYVMPYGYGPHAGKHAFGHGGNQSSIAFADPEHSLAAVIVLNGLPGERPHQKRMNALLDALYRDLGLA